MEGIEGEPATVDSTEKEQPKSGIITCTFTEDVQKSQCDFAIQLYRGTNKTPHKTYTCAFKKLQKAVACLLLTCYKLEFTATESGTVVKIRVRDNALFGKITIMSHIIPLHDWYMLGRCVDVQPRKCTFQPENLRENTTYTEEERSSLLLSTLFHQRSTADVLEMLNISTGLSSSTDFYLPTTADDSPISMPTGLSSSTDFYLPTTANDSQIPTPTDMNNDNQHDWKINTFLIIIPVVGLIILVLVIIRALVIRKRHQQSMRADQATKLKRIKERRTFCRKAKSCTRLREKLFVQRSSHPSVGEQLLCQQKWVSDFDKQESCFSQSGDTSPLNPYSRAQLLKCVAPEQGNWDDERHRTDDEIASKITMCTLKESVDDMAQSKTSVCLQSDEEDDASDVGPSPVPEKENAHCERRHKTTAQDAEECHRSDDELQP